MRLYCDCFDVGRAIDELTQERVDILKFQAKNEAEQFRAVQDAGAERELGAFRLAAVTTDVGTGNLDLNHIIGTLNSAPGSSKIAT
jgi:hypothetical protein